MNVIVATFTVDGYKYESKNQLEDIYIIIYIRLPKGTINQCFQYL